MENEALERVNNLDLSNPIVRNALRATVQGKALASFPPALKRLTEIADSESEVRALAAIRLMAENAGRMISKHELEVKMTFEDLSKRPSDGELSGLFDIQTPVIDAEIE